MRFRVSHIQKTPKSRFPHFRIAVPADLRERVGQTEIKKSLRSTDPVEAEVEATQLRREWKQRFENLRTSIADEKLQSAPLLVDDYLRKLEDDRFGDLDGAIYGMQKVIAVRLLTAWGPEEFFARGANRALAYDPDPSIWAGWESDPDPMDDIIPEDGRDALIERLGHLNRNAETLGFGYREMLQHILEKQRWDAVRFEILMIEQATRTPIPFDDPFYAAVAEHLVRRLLDYRSHRWNMELLAALNLPTSTSSTLAVVPAIAPIHAVQIGARAVDTPADNLGKNADGMKPLSVGLQRWKELKKPGASAIVEAERAVGRFVDLYGDKAVALISEDELYDYRDFLETMPTNLSLPAIRASGQSLRNAVARAWEEKPDREKLSPGSVKKDIGALSAIFGTLKQDRWIKLNLAAGISVSGYSKKRKGQKNPRLPLRPSMMKTLFESPMFTGCAGKRDIQRTEPGPLVYQDELYWTFLFGATAGPRLEEVGQILLDDIEVVENEGQAPIVGIYMTGTGEDQSAKNDESIRVIIVHPRLIELGFLSFVKDRKDAGATRLFDLQKSAIGTWTKELSRRINRYLDRTVIDDPRYVWYSMRHEFADRSEINISESTSRKIMGHARGRLYGLGAPLQHVARELDKLDVGFIDWGRLRAAADRERC